MGAFWVSIAGAIAATGMVNPTREKENDDFISFSEAFEKWFYFLLYFSCVPYKQRWGQRLLCLVSRPELFPICGCLSFSAHWLRKPELCTAHTCPSLQLTFLSGGPWVTVWRIDVYCWRVSVLSYQTIYEVVELQSDFDAFTGSQG